ncbi:hypothetical protein D3C81_1986680 [compost metagenome]
MCAIPGEACKGCGAENDAALETLVNLPVIILKMLNIREEQKQLRTRQTGCGLGYRFLPVLE